MKKKTQGLIVAAFFGVILLTSTLSIAFNSTPKQNLLEKNTVTGTPADNFPDAQRPKFCGTDDAKSTQYVIEYKIPTACTQPLAITVDPQGTVWFAQTNAGKIAKFDPQSKQFTEFDNPGWPQKGHSMMWGIDYSYDGNIWFTDDTYNSIWKFSTTNGIYEQIGFPTSGETLPHHLKVAGNQVIVNDFYGGKISFFDTRQMGREKTYTNIPSPIPGSFVGGFDIDSHGNIWYTNWILRQGGALVKFDYTAFSKSGLPSNNSTALQYSEAFNLPPTLGTPIGLSVDERNQIWIADTSASSFFKFDQDTKTFTRYVTSDSRPSVYGNMTGIIKTPVTGPYWTQINDGKLVINEQIGNAIAVFDIGSESLVEYQIPSQNPNWADCEGQSGCGIAQAFGIAATGDRVWFTEWVENNIGMVDLTKKLPLELSVAQKDITIPRGQSTTVDLHLASSDSTSVVLLAKTTAEFGDIAVQIPTKNILLSGSQVIPVSITANQSALPGVYKVLISARTNDVTVSQFVTVTVTQ